MIFNLKKIQNYTTVLFIMSMMVIPRSYLLIKLFFLIVFFYFFIVQVYREQKIYKNANIFIFYGLIILIGSTWCLIGYLNNGSISGIIANFRLWVVWSFCYSIIILIFTQRNTLLLLHKAVVLSGILISIINFIGVYSVFLGFNFFPESFVKELDLMIGFHEGYVQITSHNIGTLFFIIPYLIALQFRKDSSILNNKWTKLSLVLCLLLAIFSGRRALWLVVLMCPILIYFFSLLINNTMAIKRNYKMLIYTALLFGIVGIVIVTQSKIFDNPTIEHLKDAFSAEDERSIQKVSLVKSFFDYPFFGSGFGVGSGVVRSSEAAWLYELTYYQILFNFGIIGSLLILFVLFFFIAIALKKIRKYKNNSLIPFCIVIGIFSFAIGAYSNPYFGSFDFLIYISMIPYLASINLSNTSKNIFNTNL
jgi:hypothetical protein